MLALLLAEEAKVVNGGIDTEALERGGRCLQEEIRRSPDSNGEFLISFLHTLIAFRLECDSV